MTEKFMKTGFLPADILLPKDCDMSKWSVVACDQYTSEPEYWEKTSGYVGDAKSCLNLIFPEIYLEDGDADARIKSINSTMQKYLDDGIFTLYENTFIYVERSVGNSVRKGIVGVVDLERYDYRKGTKPLIRATEGTVAERIPPRARIRRNAPLELPHIMILIDDKDRTVIEPVNKLALKKVYDFDLMHGSGHIEGYILPPDSRIADAFDALYNAQEPDNVMLYAVGDGNHSLATAKECWNEVKKTLSDEEIKTHPARFALAEIVNIHDDSLVFEPIHRVVFDCDAEKLIEEFKSYYITDENDGQKITYCKGNETKSLYVKNPPNSLAVGTLQQFIDDYCKTSGARVDYIHGEDVTRRLSEKENAIGFLLEPMDKGELFAGVRKDGALPRKTFSMGEACEKRFYIECRKIK